MKLIIRLLFLLMPVLANCQTSQPGSDSLYFPSLSREWSVYDFQQVYRLLIARQNGPADQMLTSKNNAPLFEKMTNIKSYWFLYSEEQSPAQRIAACDSVQILLGKVIMNYYKISNLINGKLNMKKR